MNRFIWLQYILGFQTFIKMLLKCCVLLNTLNLKRMLKTDIKKTNVNKEIMLVKSSSLSSFSIRCLALTTCYPLLILIFLHGLFTSGIFTSYVYCLRPCVLDCSGVLFCSPTCPNPYWLCFVYPILLADHGPCLFFIFLL
jgi:hypothetical protein